MMALLVCRPSLRNDPPACERSPRLVGADLANARSSAVIVEDVCPGRIVVIHESSSDCAAIICRYL
jgi:hypothetical protein